MTGRTPSHHPRLRLLVALAGYLEEIISARDVYFHASDYTRNLYCMCILIMLQFTVFIVS